MILNVPTKTGGQLAVEVCSVYEFENYAANTDFSKFFAPYKKGVIWNDPLAFDIETSHIDDEQGRFTFMYIWQFYVAGRVVIGHTWDELATLLRIVHDITKAAPTRPAFIYVHNLSYECAFFKSRFLIKSAFARENNRPLNAALDGDLNGLIFRCSMSLSNSSLRAVAQDTISCPVYKQDFVYDTLRLPSYRLTESELSYCVCDVLILYYYIKDMMKDYALIVNIPLTATGIVRKSAYRDFGRKSYWQQDFLRNRLNDETYSVYRAAFAGGDVHCAPEYVGKTVVVRSYDLTSSYPSRWLEPNFPLSPPILVDDPDVDTITRLKQNNKLFVADVVLCNVRLKNIYSFDYIQAAHCLALKKPKCENGRIVSAEILRICRTCFDLEIIERNYDFDILKVERLVYHARRGLLPKAFRDYVFKLYRVKTELRGVPGHEREYMVHGKIPLNSCYGMTVTDIASTRLKYDDTVMEWVDETDEDGNVLSLHDILLKFYGSRNSFLTYQWGVFVTALSRYDLHRALSAIGKDCVYWDTDSVKYIGDHQDVFDRLNAEKLSSMKDFSIDDVAPKNRHGDRVPIGLWDPEHGGEQFLFKAFGSKKYFCQYPDGTETITVAGLNKQKALEYFNLNGIGLFEDVTVGDDLAPINGKYTGTVIPPEWSGRTCSEIVNTPRTVVINGERVTECSYMNIFNVPYTFGDTDEHILYTAWVKREISEVKKYARL